MPLYAPFTILNFGVVGVEAWKVKGYVLVSQIIWTKKVIGCY